jgi:hypothetical protein
MNERRRDLWVPPRIDVARFVIGANLPWLTYGCDFGASVWHPQGGLASRPDLDRLRAVLDALADAGVEVVRWFLFCDGRSGVRFDSCGTPAGLDERVFPDVETALALVDRSRLRLCPVVLDFHWCLPGRIEKGVVLRGRRDVLVDADKREALLERAVVPLWRRYGGEPAIWAWDLVNEPEWVTLGFGHWNPFRAVEPEHMRAFLREAIRLAHAETRHAVTVGSASAAWLGLVRDLGLDLYQTHWYDRLERLAPFDTPVEAMGLDRPVVLGEFPTRGSARDIPALLDAARRLGYAGAFAWSVLADDPASDRVAGVAGLAAWRDRASAPAGLSVTSQGAASSAKDFFVISNCSGSTPTTPVDRPAEPSS